MNPLQIMDEIERRYTADKGLPILVSPGDWQSLRTATEARADVLRQALFYLREPEDGDLLEALKHNRHCQDEALSIREEELTQARARIARLEAVLRDSLNVISEMEDQHGVDRSEGDEVVSGAHDVLDGSSHEHQSEWSVEHDVVKGGVPCIVITSPKGGRTIVSSNNHSVAYEFLSNLTRQSHAAVKAEALRDFAAKQSNEVHRITIEYEADRIEQESES